MRFSFVEAKKFLMGNFDDALGVCSIYIALYHFIVFLLIVKILMEAK